MDISISLSEERIKELIIADVRSKIPGINVTGVNIIAGRGGNGLRAEIESDFGETAVKPQGTHGSTARKEPEPVVKEETATERSEPVAETEPEAEVVPEATLEELSDEVQPETAKEETQAEEATPKARKLFGKKASEE